MSEAFAAIDPTVGLIVSVAMVCVTVVLVASILSGDDSTPEPAPADNTPAVDPYPGLKVWTSDDGKKCIEFVNNFRADPTTIPLTSAQTSKGVSAGTA